MSLRIASYNLWNGAEETYFRLVDFAKAQNFDVLCLQEINGWQNDNFARLKDFADRAGFTDYEYGNSNSEYKMATFTALPAKSRTVHVEGFWHSAIETHMDFSGVELVVVNIHLDPWKEDPRLREVNRLLKLIDTGKPTIIVGDFNSLSRADNYPPEFVAELMRREFYKFGQGELDFRVTDTLAAAGFVDAAAVMGRLDITAPTSYSTSQDKGEAVPVSEVPARTDYAYISGDLRSALRDFAVLKSEETDKISDHYPIVLTLDNGAAASPADQPVSQPDSTQAGHTTPAVAADSEPVQAEKPSEDAGEGEVKLR